MLNNDWFTDSDGNVESPQGYFGWVFNEEGDNLTASNKEFMSAFGEVISAYGWPYHEHLIGVFVASINSDGIIFIQKLESKRQARDWFAGRVKDYAAWLSSSDDDA